MKTGYGFYYIFFNVNDFWKTVDYFKSEGRYWIQESHLSYNPNVNQQDMPVVLSVDDTNMMFGIISYNKDRYFSDPEFVKFYNYELRKNKLKRILKEI